MVGPGTVRISTSNHDLNLPRAFPFMFSARATHIPRRSSRLGASIAPPDPMVLVSTLRPLLKPSLTHPGLANPWLPVPFWPLTLLGASFTCRTATVRAVTARYSRSGPSWVMRWIWSGCMSLKSTVAASTVTKAIGLVVQGKSTGEGWVLMMVFVTVIIVYTRAADGYLMPL